MSKTKLLTDQSSTGAEKLRLYKGAKLRVWSKKTLATEVTENTEKM